MKNKSIYSINPWKYPLWFLVLIGVLTGVLVLIDAWFGVILPAALSDFLKLLGVLPILISLLSTVIPGFLSAKVKNRIMWLISQPGMNQLYYLLTFEAFTIILTTIVKIVWPQVSVFAYLDVSANFIACSTLIVAYILLLRILRNN